MTSQQTSLKSQVSNLRVGAARSMFSGELARGSACLAVSVLRALFFADVTGSFIHGRLLGLVKGQL